MTVPRRINGRIAEKYNFVQPNSKVKAFDKHKEVEFIWNCLLQDDSLEVGEFLKLAGKDGIVSRLFPFTSLFTLCFSRCTGYPYDTDNLPNVTPKQFEQLSTQINRNNNTSESESLQNEKIFVVTKNRKVYLGEGNATEALKLVRENLPDCISPAIKEQQMANRYSNLQT